MKSFRTFSSLGLLDSQPDEMQNRIYAQGPEPIIELSIPRLLTSLFGIPLTLEGKADHGPDAPRVDPRLPRLFRHIADTREKFFDLNGSGVLHWFSHGFLNHDLLARATIAKCTL